MAALNPWQPHGSARADFSAEYVTTAAAVAAPTGVWGQIFDGQACAVQAGPVLRGSMPRAHLAAPLFSDNVTGLPPKASAAAADVTLHAVAALGEALTQEGTQKTGQGIGPHPARMIAAKYPPHDQPNSIPSRQGAKARLGPSDWIMAGFAALAEAGPDAIRIEALARNLSATKGSFYWHFRDLRALKTAMLDAWEVLGSSDITSAVRRPGLDAAARLHLLVELLSAPLEPPEQAALEPAIRDWARSDPAARAALARVDQCRIADLAGLIGAAGQEAAAADQSARIFYATLIGLEQLRISTSTALQPPLRAVAAAILAPTQPHPIAVSAGSP